jgi:NADH-quinone oxidoreductase subunit C
MEIIDNYIKNSNFEIIKLNIDGFLSYQIKMDNLLNFLHFLKTSENLRFTILTDLFAIDFLNIDNKKARFEIIYNLLSLKLNIRILIKINIEDNIKIPSITSIFKSACWYEREIYDMFGIYFSDLLDHRRILTDYDFVGYPLRKDFPLTGHTQIRYDENTKKIIHEPVTLEHDYREFNFKTRK